MPSTATSRIDQLSTSVAVKAPVHAVATSNITLSGLQTIGGVVLDGSILYRVLLTAQTNSVDNGIWDASTGSWSRSKDFDGARDAVKGTLVIVQSSTNTLYRLTTSNPIVPGTTALSFELAAVNLTQADITAIGMLSTGIKYDITPAEQAAGVTPVNYYIPPYDVSGYVDYLRYGNNTIPGTTDMSSVLAAMIAVCPAGGEMRLPDSEMAFSTPLVITKSITITGTGGREYYDNSWDNGGGSRLHYTGLTGDAITIQPPNATNSRIKVRLRGFVVRGARTSPGSAVSGRCFYINGRNLAGTAVHLDVEDVYACEAKDEGWYLTGAIYGGNFRNWGAYNCGKNGYRCVGSPDVIGEMVYETSRFFQNGTDGTGNDKDGVWCVPGGTSNAFNGLSSTNNAGYGATLQGGSFTGSGWQFESNSGANQLYLGSAGGGAGLTHCVVDSVSIHPGAAYTGNCVNVTSDAGNVKISGLFIADTLGAGGKDIVVAGSNCSITGISASHAIVTNVTATDAYLENIGLAFNPTLVFGGGSTGLTYTTQLGRYSRSGNCIDFVIYLVLSAKGSSTGAAAVTGLPAASVNVTNLDQSATIEGDNLVNTADVLMARIAANDTRVLLYRYFDGARTAMQDTDFNNNSVIAISGRYFIA